MGKEYNIVISLVNGKEIEFECDESQMNDCKTDFFTNNDEFDFLVRGNKNGDCCIISKKHIVMMNILKKHN